MVRFVCQHFGCGAAGEIEVVCYGERVQCPECKTVFTWHGQTMAPNGAPMRLVAGWRVYNEEVIRQEKAEEELRALEAARRAHVAIQMKPSEECDRCGELIWKFESLSPNEKASTWTCEYCGKRVIVRSDVTKGEKYGREAIPRNVRDEVWRRDGGRCIECGTNAKLEYDHIIPVSRGGSNTARNIQLLCETCNRRKGDRI